MNGFRVFTSILMVLVVSGCVGSQGPGDDSVTPTTQGAPTGGESGNATQEPAPASPPRELLNTTLTYPRMADDMPDEETANVPADAQVLLLRFQAQRECPAGYYDAPQLHVIPPNGTAYEYDVLRPSQVRPQPYSCDGQPSRPGDVVEDLLEDADGQWTFQTSGTGTMQVDVVFIMNPR